jgi:hypothetical protein
MAFSLFSKGRGNDPRAASASAIDAATAAALAEHPPEGMPQAELADAAPPPYAGASLPRAGVVDGVARLRMRPGYLVHGWCSVGGPPGGRRRGGRGGGGGGGGHVRQEDH